MQKPSACTERDKALAYIQKMAERARAEGNIALSDAYATIIIQAQRGRIMEAEQWVH